MNLYRVAWHLLGAAAIFLIPVQLAHGAVWAAPADPVWFASGMALAYLACVVAAAIAVPISGSGALARWWAPLGTLALYLLYLLVAKAFYSRSMLVVALTIGVASLALSKAIGRTRGRTAVLALLTIVVATLLAGFVDNPTTRAAHLGVAHETIATSLYNLRVTRHRGLFGRREPLTVDGGGLVAYHGSLLLATGEGRLYLLSTPTSGQDLAITPIAARVPLNADAFARDAPEGVQTKRFRTAGFALQESGDTLRLFVSHHYWHDDLQCFTLRVSVLETTAAALTSTAQAWRTLFETTPCLPLETSEIFTGNQAGGRMLFPDPRHLLLTVGDHGFDGVNTAGALPQDATTSYGKTLLLDVDTGEPQVYTVGHRNPQGLYLAPTGETWLTEQGAQGGDELNLLTRGADYGWPSVTYGTDYDHLTWPPNRVQGDHAGFKLPVFSWVPSIVVSSLVGVEGPAFPLWTHDLMASSLTDEALWRMRVRDGRVVVAERIPIRERIRDAIELPDGRLVLWTDSRSIVLIEPGEPGAK